MNAVPPSPAPLRFLSAPTIEEHIPAGALKAQAQECRAAVDLTEAAAERYRHLADPTRDREAAGVDNALESAALAAPEWQDPGHPAADQLAADRASAHRELVARAVISDRLVVKFSKSVSRELDSLTAADLAALDKAAPKVSASLEKLRPMLAEADVRRRRVEWLTWLGTHRLDGPPPRMLAPERMPSSGDSFITLLDRLLVLAAEH